MPARQRKKESTDTSSSTFVVWAALLGNLAVAVTKFVAAGVTGSSAMLAEAIHSTVDSGNELLLLYGLRQSRKIPEPDYPFGHGREIYFWSFVVAILVFTLGACVATWEGIDHIRHPEPVERPGVVYAVLALSAVFEGVTWYISLRAFRRSEPGATLWQSFRRSKDPPNFIVLIEDTAALLGIAVAALGTWLAGVLDEPRLDGAASIAIGLLLGVVAFVLGRETKSLLIGERADPKLVADSLRTIASFEGVASANGMLTAQLSPDQVIAIASVAFADELRTPQIETLIERMEAAVIERHPEIGRLFVKPQTPEAYEAALQKRYAQGVAPPAPG